MARSQWANLFRMPGVAPECILDDGAGRHIKVG